MKLYESKYSYAKIDHTEYKNLMSQMIHDLQKGKDLYIDTFNSDSDYYLANNIDYYITLIGSDISKSMVVAILAYYNENTAINHYYLKVKNIKIKLGWYYHNNLFDRVQPMDEVM